MTTPARYWRVSFRSTTSYTNAQLGFFTMKLFDAAGTHVSAAATITTTNLLNSTTYPVANLIDNSDTSVTVWSWGSGAVSTFTNVTFDLGSSVLVDYVVVNLSSATYNGNTLITANLVDFLVYSSTDNVTYTLQAAHYRPAQTAGVEARMAATVQSAFYPIPSRSNLGGSGGIFGIVSEDGVALPNRPVYLFERETMGRVGFATTDENGGYAFNGLNTARDFLVMSVDPSGPPYKNAIVWDRITPINALANLEPQSRFWARRARDAASGQIIGYKNYLDGVTYDYFQASELARAEQIQTPMTGYAGYNFLAQSAAGGAVRFLKSSRTDSDRGKGMFVFPDGGVFSGSNTAGSSGNYSNLTFEYVFVAPTAAEASLIMVWGGTRDSDDIALYGGYWTGATTVYGWCGGPTLEVTPAGAVNVRFPLGSKNRSTVRATTTITPGQAYHVMVSYAQDDYIKLYVNGTLVQTTSIVGGGRLYGNFVANGSNTALAFNSWDSVYASREGALRRLSAFFVGGADSSNVASNSAYGGVPSGYGGGFGMAALYGRSFSDSDVATFYDSYANPSTHTVLPAQSGYMAEVEADNPQVYYRFNELTGSIARPLIGATDFDAQYISGAVLGANGFVSGSTAVTTTNGGVAIWSGRANSAFTVELFCRPSSVTGTQRLLVQRIYNGNAPILLSIVSGALQLALLDLANSTTTFSLGTTLVANQAYHIAVSYDPWDSKRLKAYVNGALVSDQSGVVLFDSFTNPWGLFVGQNATGTGPTYSERFQGEIAELAVYGYEVPAARIAAHYAARNS